MTASGLPSAADVQRFGLLSAATVVARYAEVVDRALSGEGGRWLGAGQKGVPRQEPLRGRLPGVGTPDPQWVVETAPHLVAAFLRLLDAGAALVEQTQAAGTPAGEAVLELPAAAPGGSSEATLWVHNPTGASVALSLHATPLVSGAGHLVPAASVECRPSHLSRLGADASGAVGIHVAVPAHQPEGRYHGLVVGSVAPEPVRVVLEVTYRGTS